MRDVLCDVSVVGKILKRYLPGYFGMVEYMCIDDERVLLCEVYDRRVDKNFNTFERGRIRIFTTFTNSLVFMGRGVRYRLKMVKLGACIVLNLYNGVVEANCEVYVSKVLRGKRVGVCTGYEEQILLIAKKQLLDLIFTPYPLKTLKPLMIIDNRDRRKEYVYVIPR